MKSSPFSIRLSVELNARLTDEAQRTRRSRSALIEALADEALRCRRFPGIAFRDQEPWRRAWVIGTGLDVWEIIAAHKDFGSTEKMITAGNLTQRQIQVALAYYREYPEEIDLAMAENGRSIEELQSLYPTIDVKIAQ